MIFAALLSRAAAKPALDLMAVHAGHADFVWRSLQRLGVRPADLEDVFQEVFIVVHKRLHTFDGSSALTTWLFGVCLRVAAAHRRRAWFRREVPSTDTVDTREAPASESPDEMVAAQEARAALHGVLDRMDLDKRAVFVMFEIDEVPSEEIATILGVPVGTVWSRLSAARKQFETIARRERARRGSLP
ncbi:RNA polymerase sigma factor RpoE [Minicystis rosea]|nr:RNA polymerase sigma factor RpoE [Minicystis rosea]